MDIVAFGTPFGLAFASGLNAYLPLLAFALSVRWLHLYPVSPHFAFITQSWFIAVLIILSLLDFLADKIPLIDHLWNAVHTFVRPMAGAVVAVVASSQALPATPITAVTSHAGSGAAVVALSAIPLAGVGLLVLLIIGGVLAALSHTTKTTARLVSTITTAGFLNIVLSLVEDVLVFIVILLSLFAPTIMLLLLALFVLALATRYMGARTTWMNRHRHI
jgi:hypothetical protein